jgi:phytoene synthase
LARACDLGVAMQLTNIARDVGEDARAGRIYLPLAWLEDAGIDKDAFLANSEAHPEIKRMVKRLLHTARGLYVRSEAGIGSLPLQARTGIFAARYIYAAIGNAVARNGFDSINHRGRTNARQKLGLIATSGVRTAASLVLPKSPMLFAQPLNEVQFLVDAVATNAPRADSWGVGRTGSFLAVMADLKARDAGSPDTSGVAAE